MDRTLFENIRHGKGNIIEFFGLSRSGKSTLLKEGLDKGKEGVMVGDVPKISKVLYFKLFLLRHPLLSLKLFWKLNSNWIKIDMGLRKYLKMFLLRNSYLMSVLAKYQKFSKVKEEFLIDEYVTQAIFMIMHKKATYKEINDILKMLPPTGKILLVETPRKTRYERIKKTRFPAQQIDKEYSVQWMKNTEHNYEIVKKILKEDYGPVRKNFKI